MSQETVQVVRSLFAAFAKRDLQAAAGVLDPDVEVRPAIVGGPEGVVYRGLDGMSRFWADIDAAWAGFQIRAEEFRELDGDVVVLGRAVASGRASGITLDAAAAWIARVRDGRITYFRSFSSQHEALEAAGLRE
jgi:ketosteroid isomerase-like protein